MPKPKFFIVAITKDSKSNLCDNCCQNFATCQNIIIGFGNGQGNDNIIMCSDFNAKDNNDIIRGEIHLRIFESNIPEPSFTDITEAENQAYESAGANAYFGNGFRDGAKWMLQYIKVSMDNK